MRQGTYYEVTNEQGSRPVRERFVVPETFTLRVEDPNLPCPIEVDIDASGPQPICVAVRAPVLTGELLRQLPLARFVREGTEQAVRPTADTRAITGAAAIVGTGTISATGTVVRLEDQVAEFLRRRREHRASNAKTPDDDLALAAAVYRRALSLGTAPTATVQRELRLRSQAQAARWIAKARAAGHLGPAPAPGRKGEIRVAIGTATETDSAQPITPRKVQTKEEGQET